MLGKVREIFRAAPEAFAGAAVAAAAHAAAPASPASSPRVDRTTAISGGWCCGWPMTSSRTGSTNPSMLGRPSRQASQSTTVWPTSASERLPRSRRPLLTTPAPMPVETVR